MNPTNGELNIVLDNLKGHINEKFEDVKVELSEIKTQVKTTNGRVKKLELWKAFILGAIAVITSVGIPLFIYVYQQRDVDTERKLQELEIALREVLKETYNLEIK